MSERCPNIKGMVDGPDHCDLWPGPCLLEVNLKCEIYEDWLKSEEHELDKRPQL